jgi:hypothetical protein
MGLLLHTLTAVVGDLLIGEDVLVLVPCGHWEQGLPACFVASSNYPNPDLLEVGDEALQLLGQLLESLLLPVVVKVVHQHSVNDLSHLVRRDKCQAIDKHDKVHKLCAVIQQCLSKAFGLYVPPDSLLMVEVAASDGSLREHDPHGVEHCLLEV